MLDGAPPHHTNAVRQQLHYLFPDKLIGRAAGNNAQYRPDIARPPRSPDFNPCDFFYG
ncbi:ATP-dependent RNA helicase DHX8-like, partial [Aphis craccivora]